jgi:hypothetical protein
MGIGDDVTQAVQEHPRAGAALLRELSTPRTARRAQSAVPVGYNLDHGGMNRPRQRLIGGAYLTDVGSKIIREVEVRGLRVSVGGPANESEKERSSKKYATVHGR